MSAPTATGHISRCIVHRGRVIPGLFMSGRGGGGGVTAPLIEVSTLADLPSLQEPPRSLLRSSHPDNFFIRTGKASCARILVRVKGGKIDSWIRVGTKYEISNVS
jgi:hypothetical protein